MMWLLFEFYLSTDIDNINLYRPCPFQRDRQGDDGGQNQAYAP